eukprot:scaffold129984_cov29-Attheya_sp.AAC.1
MVDTAIAPAYVRTIGGLEFIGERNSTGEADRRRENNKPVGYRTASKYGCRVMDGSEVCKRGRCGDPKKEPIGLGGAVNALLACRFLQY